MDDYNEKRACPLTQYTFNEICINLTKWRDTLREELETLIYIKNCISLNNDNNLDNHLQQQKILSLIPKLEALCLKEIDCINDFLTSIAEHKYIENSEALYSKVESIRENYNKIILNIQKMTNSVPILETFRLKYRNCVLPKEKDIQTISQREEMKQIAKTPAKKVIQGNRSMNQINNNCHNNNSINANDQIDRERLERIKIDLDELNQNKTEKPHSRKEINHCKTYCHAEENKSNTITINNAKNANKKKLNLSRPTTPLIKTHTDKLFNTTSNLTIANDKKIKHETLNPPNHPLQSKQEKEAIAILSDEIKHIKSYYEELQQTIREHCLINNKKNELEQIKKENIKLIADVNILKDDMADMMKNYQILSNSINMLQIENSNLKQQNQNLLAHISNGNANNNIDHPGQYENNCLNSNDLLFSNSLQENNFPTCNDIKLNNHKMSQQISELSAFNSNIMASNERIPNQNKGINNQCYQLTNKNVTNLSELTKLNNTITENTRNATPIHHNIRRYLIPKIFE